MKLGVQIRRATIGGSRKKYHKGVKFGPQQIALDSIKILVLNRFRMAANIDAHKGVEGRISNEYEGVDGQWK
ncbi:hypothetical protein A9Q96_13800 [Rhodobacterales bacterium 52_120_T64]|nr:hypothetical protein A9Q96_13800 [Rhodobacterales bacterium 52_120_T64]